MLKFFKSRSKVKVKVTSSKFMVPLEGLVIRITRAKYERLISTIKKVMANVKVYWRTDRQTDRQSDYYRAPA